MENRSAAIFGLRVKRESYEYFHNFANCFCGFDFDISGRWPYSSPQSADKFGKLSPHRSWSQRPTDSASRNGTLLLHRAEGLIPWNKPGLPRKFWVNERCVAIDGMVFRPYRAPLTLVSDYKVRNISRLMLPAVAWSTKKPLKPTLLFPWLVVTM